MDIQKVTIPKSVAECLEYCKRRKNLAIAFVGSYALENDTDKWIYNNQETFARAWLDGYEVEQEPLYQVVISNTQNYKKQIQQLVNQGKNWFFCGNDVNRFRYKFTKGQIEAAGFGWVFDCSGVVIKVEPTEE